MILSAAPAAIASQLGVHLPVMPVRPLVRTSSGSGVPHRFGEAKDATKFDCFKGTDNEYREQPQVYYSD
jgi:hypothetical protein